MDNYKVFVVYGDGREVRPVSHWLRLSVAEEHCEGWHQYLAGTETEVTSVQIRDRDDRVYSEMEI